jgi:hypothetical protein
MNRLVLVCGVGVGASLYFLYALFTAIFLERLVLSTVTAIELEVVAVQFIKVALLVGRYRTKPPRLEVLLWVSTIEILVAIALLLAFAVDPILPFQNLYEAFFSVWTAGIALAFPPYLIYISVVQMTRSRNPFLLLSPALEFCFLAFAASSLLAISGTLSLTNFFIFLVGAANAALSSGPVPGLSTLYLLVPSLVTFCSLIVRITIPTPESATPPRVTFVLPLLAAVVGLAWIYAGVRVAPNTLLSFTVPGVLLAGALFAYMRR